MDYTPVIAAAITGLFGIVGIIVSYFLTKSSFNKKMEKERQNLSVLANATFGKHALKRLSDIERVLGGVKSINDSIFEDAALTKLDQCLTELSQISNGRIRIEHPVELTNIPAELSLRMKSLQATSLWNIDPAQGLRRKRFVELQVNAIKERNATIQRLFIVDDATIVQHKEHFLDRMLSDQKDGVQVRWILDSDWMCCEAAAEPIDFGIWDDELVWLYERNIIEENRIWLAYLIRSEAEKKRYTDIFRANWQTARSLEALNS